ncbi:hypothetical protein H5P36_08115 [Bacillus sp. APMAM]|nr:hypothetical protein [Bacillus sp. APMAM]RTZ56361.1 hypothetical protein EKO25_07760 [Bacillus sp. SAJ1]
MSLSLLLLIALVLAIFSIRSIRINFKMKYQFHSAFTAGGAILAINLLLIAITALGVFFIPFSTPIFIVLSPVASVVAWAYIKYCFPNPLLKRLCAILIGQSIYVFLFIYFFYKNQHLEPLYPGEDTFMRGLGLLIGMVVCIAATLIGLITFLLPKVSGTKLE